MWVKSQNEKLLVDSYIFSINKVSNGIKAEWEINGKGGAKLGVYNSEEKAMKVLRKIETSLLGYGGMHYDSPYDCPMAGTEYHGIFVMPSIESEE